MSNYHLLDGINIQWPWSELLISGKKTIETRGYPLPERLAGKQLALIETPGKKGRKEAGIVSARIVGTITFKKSYMYGSKKDWTKEYDLHLVPENDIVYGYTAQKPKWGWVVESVVRLAEPVSPPKKRGIVYAKNCRVPI